jgi:hypothetical protein
MKRSHWLKLAAVVLLTAAAAPAWSATAADKSPLSWVPASAPIVVHLNGLETVRDHVVAFLKNAVPDQADDAQKHIDQFLKEGQDGRKLRGLKKDGPIFIAVWDIPNFEEPAHMAIVAAVTDYAEFRDGFLKEQEKKDLKRGDGYESVEKSFFYFVDKKDYVVLTPYKDIAVSFVKGEAGLDGKLNKAQAAKFLQSDLGVFVNVEALTKKHADEIKAFRKQMEEGLAKVEESAPKAQKAQFAIVKKFIGPAFQALDDCQEVFYTVDVHPDGVVLHKEAQLRAGSETAKVFKDSKVSAFKELDKLPAGETFYTGVLFSPSLQKLFGSLLQGYLTDPDSKDAKAFAEAMDEFFQAGPSGARGAFHYPPSGIQVIDCAHPDKAIAAQIKMWQAMGSGDAFQGVHFKDKPTVKEKAKKYKDFEFASFHASWDLDKLFDAPGAGGKPLPAEVKKALEEGFKKMMGEDMNIWLGTDGKQLLQVMAKDWDAAEKELDQYFKPDHPAGDGKAFAAARKALPAESSVLVLLDVGQYAAVMTEFMKPILAASGAKLPPGFPPAAPDKAAFVGISVTLSPDGGSADLFVSAESVRLIHDGYIKPFLGGSKPESKPIQIDK